MTPRARSLAGRGHGTGAAGRSRVAALLLAALLPPTAWLWAAVFYPLQLEARNRLEGTPGESSPLYLALLGLPLVALVSAACLPGYRGAVSELALLPWRLLSG
jgi:hypothetical protein